MSMDFGAIQKRIALNDEIAFKQLFEHFFAGLFSYCKSILKSGQLAEEVVEDIFIKLWEHRESLPQIRNIAVYLYKAAKYASLNALEKERNRSSQFEDVGESLSFGFARTETQLISKENCERISAA